MVNALVTLPFSRKVWRSLQAYHFSSPSRLGHAEPVFALNSQTNLQGNKRLTLHILLADSAAGHLTNAKSVS